MGGGGGASVDGLLEGVSHRADIRRRRSHVDLCSLTMTGRPGSAG